MRSSVSALAIITLFGCSNVFAADASSVDDYTIQVDSNQDNIGTFFVEDYNNTTSSYDYIIASNLTLTTINSTNINLNGNLLSTSGNVTITDNVDINGQVTTDGISDSVSISTTGTMSALTADIGTGGLDVDGMTNTDGISDSVGISTTGTMSALTADVGTGGLDVDGTTNLDDLNVEGTTNINTTVDAATTIGSSSNTSAVSIVSGSSSIVTDNSGVTIQGSTTNINTTSGDTNIGNSSATNTITGDTNTITGTTNNIVSTTTNINIAGGDTNIGNSTSTNTILGTTNINTTGTADTTIGNALNDTTINSASTTINSTTIDIGTTANATTTTIGNTNTSSSTLIYGGNSSIVIQDGSASISSSNTSGFTAYSTPQTAGTDYILINGDATSQGLVSGNSISNIIVGDTLVDGNMYVNGTLTYTSDTAATTTVSSGSSSISGSMDISYSGGAYVDENGALYNSGATEATASLTLTNDLGNTHGIVVTTDQTTISGGTTSSSLTLNDNGATFSDSSTGRPVQVHGVADGTNDFDAVNLRQLGGAIASVTAIANIPQIEPDKKFSLGLGFGNYDGYNGFALGAKYRINDNLIFQTSAAKSGSQRHTIGAGLSYSW